MQTSRRISGRLLLISRVRAWFQGGKTHRGSIHDLFPCLPERWSRILPLAIASNPQRSTLGSQQAVRKSHQVFLSQRRAAQMSTYRNPQHRPDRVGFDRGAKVQDFFEGIDQRTQLPSGVSTDRRRVHLHYGQRRFQMLCLQASARVPANPCPLLRDPLRRLHLVGKILSVVESITRNDKGIPPVGGKKSDDR